MQLRKGGIVLGESDERWEDTPNGPRRIVTGTFFPKGALLAPMRRLAAWRLGEQLGHWPRHNVEEDGCFAYFLRELFDCETR